MDFDYPFGQYTRETYNSILIQLQQDVSNQTEGLSKLSSLLTYGDQEKLMDFPIDDFSREVLHILNSTNNENIAMLASKCVFGLLEAHARSTSCLINNNALQILANQLMNCKWFETAEFCLQALNIISKHRAVEISSSIGLDPLLKMIDSFTLPIQRCALTTAVNITKVDITQRMASHIPKLIELSKSSDPQMQKLSIITINNIASRVSPESFSPEISEKLCQSAPLFLDALINLSTNSLHISKIIQSNIDFEKIFSESKNNDKQMSILKLILNLLPSARCLNQFPIPKHPRPNESMAFAIKVQPVLIKLLLENPLSLKYLLLCITFTLNVHKFELTEEIAFVLRGFGKLPENSPYVLAILTFFETSPLLGQSHILDSLICGDMSRQQKSWFTKTLNKLRKKVNQTLKESSNYSELSIEGLIGLITNQNISKFEFLAHGVKRLKELISDDDNSAPKITYHNAKILADFLLNLLNVVDIPTISDTRVADSFIEEISQVLILPIKFPQTDEMDDGRFTRINRFETVGMIEAAYNLRCPEENYRLENLNEMSKKNPGLRSLLFNKASNSKFTYNQLSLISRVFDPNYRRFHLEETISSIPQYYEEYNFDNPLNDTSNNDNNNSNVVKKFNANVSFFTINPRPSSNLSLVEGDCDPLPAYVPSKTFDSLTDICELLEKLSKIIRVGQNIIFSRKIRNLLINPRESLYHSSCALDTIYLHPFLFPFDIRLIAFKIMAFEPASAIRAWSKEFSINHDKLKEVLKDEPLKIMVHRDSLFTDGYLLFSELSSNQMKFEISFSNEEGIGLGPTHEFFTLFSHELCRVEREFFRTEERKRGLAVDQNGMFFSPLMNEKKASLLGKFIAKAIQMECLIDINFNPALFKLLRGKEKLTIKDVDPMYAQSLEDPQGLIGNFYFEYPGLGFPLIENGENIEVTEENLQSFIDLFTDYTCGKKMETLAKSFLDGFNSVFPFSYLDVFTDNELNNIISGDAPQITREELEKNVEISHGYNSNSEQIQMLFDIISEMSKEQQRLFIQFITGYAQLPIGGLASLDPKLSVAKKDPNDQSSPDEPLPSCMTCKNYFKLPPYSSKEIMLKKIMMAIYEGSTSFKLT